MGFDEICKDDVVLAAETGALSCPELTEDMDVPADIILVAGDVERGCVEPDVDRECEERPWVGYGWKPKLL